MPFFTKKPVRIEAVQFLRIMPASGNPFFAEDDSLDASWPTWLVEALCKQSWQEGAMWVNTFNSLHIRTLEGIMLVSPNDWVICGVKGELYPCKPDIFAVTYDAIAEEPAS
ncbi:hypothetical protein [Sphingopyxis macrogoltabida]|uniref:Phage protein n=1 Tax=Sphingopyxis macrogoltabida TaxID=33050 RepID=A0A0N9UGR6_SPHMC|nr:hypothetical protein [Sphingopyxis macrogoltabida]ALH82935.1 hypothetical protein AN936_22030 [Sphingopyxis macrogoltabida]